MGYREERLKDDLTVLARGRARFPTPPDAVVVEATNMGLQAAVDSLGPNGGVIDLPSGTSVAVDGSYSTPLVLPGGVWLRGRGRTTSIIGSPILQVGSSCGYIDLAIRPPNVAYGLRIFNSGNFLARTFFRNVNVGASFANAGDGPVDGIQLDGAGVLMGDELTCAFCTGYGLLVDSTASVPNTTLDFQTCSFVQNGLHGVHLTNSLTLARFKGGNMEDNGLLMSGTTAREFFCENSSCVELEGVDFERSNVVNLTVPTADEMVEFQNTNAVSIIGCNFVMGNSKATRSWIAQGCTALSYGKGNRYEGFGAVGVLRVSETCTNVVNLGGNHIVSGGGWLEDYSR